MCNTWAIDTPCPPDGKDFCRSLHILDSRGNSVLVSSSSVWFYRQTLYQSEAFLLFIFSCFSLLIDPIMRMLASHTILEFSSDPNIFMKVNRTLTMTVNELWLIIGFVSFCLSLIRHIHFFLLIFNLTFCHLLDISTFFPLK